MTRENLKDAVPRELLDFIKNGKKFLVAGHKEPDGDCIGCQLALDSVLRRLGKETVLCSAGPFKRTEIKPFERFFVSAPGEKDLAGARAILVDCSGPDRAGALASVLEKLPAAVIDHHGTGVFAARTEAAGGGPVYTDGRAPSATFMILKLIEALGLEPTPEEAQFLFFGLCTDTGFFRFVDTEGAETFEAAARLVRAGANPKAAHAAINGGKSLDSRKLMGFVLSRAEAYFGGKLILSTETYEETRRFGLEGRDSDSLYQLFQAVAGVEAIVLIRQESPKNCTVGFRSRDRVDVGAIAGTFGGGGHKNAAGLSAAGAIEELKPKIIAAFGDFFSSSADFNA